MSLAVVSALVSGSAFAAAPQNDSSKATINFNGKVTSSLCQVRTDNLSQDISLGEVTSAVLKASGKGKEQSFQVGLTNCDTTTTKIAYVLTDANYTPIIDNTTGQPVPTTLTYLEPKSGDNSAVGVGVFIETSTGSKIAPGSTTELQVAKDANAKALSDQTISLRAYIGTKDGQPDTNSVVQAGTVDATGVLTIYAS